MATPIAAGNAILVREYFMRGYYPTGVPVRSGRCGPLLSVTEPELFIAEFRRLVDAERGLG